VSLRRRSFFSWSSLGRFPRPGRGPGGSGRSDLKFAMEPLVALPISASDVVVRVTFGSSGASCRSGTARRSISSFADAAYPEAGEGRLRDGGVFSTVSAGSSLDRKKDASGPGGRACAPSSALREAWPSRTPACPRTTRRGGVGRSASGRRKGSSSSGKRPGGLVRRLGRPRRESSRCRSRSRPRCAGRGRDQVPPDRSVRSGGSSGQKSSEAARASRPAGSKGGRPASGFGSGA
jgi:hypothetical protein